MRCFAHRGFAGVNPENTLPAVTAAARAGADVIEVDVRRCGSGELVVCHDATVDRVTDATGAVASLTAARLAGLDVLGSGAGIPTLVAVCGALPIDVGLNVELKERGLFGDVREQFETSDRTVIVSSFDPAALAEGTGTTVDRALLLGTPTEESVPDGTLARAVDLGCSAIHPHHRQCLERFVTRAHDRGLAVNAWTVREPATTNHLAGVGVDGVIADRPDCCPGLA